MTIELYGIANCDNVKKARRWSEERGIGIIFHDYKKEGVDLERLHTWSAALGWEALLNRRGTTFRGLPEAEKADLDETRALRLMALHPSLIKRPVVEHDGPDAGGLLLGFDAERWAAVLG